MILYTKFVSVIKKNLFSLLVCIGFLGIGFYLDDVLFIFLRSKEFNKNLEYYELLESSKNNIVENYMSSDNHSTQKQKYDTLHDHLVYGALDGLVSGLGDKHTQFFNPKMTEALFTQTKGNFFGIGALLEPHIKGARIVRIFENSPAQKAGLENGDIIIKVNQEVVQNIDLPSIVEKIKGPKKSNVVLWIEKESKEKSKKSLMKKIDVIRDVIHIPSTHHKILSNTPFGYIEITSFAENTDGQFDKILRDLENQKIQGLIIDLRGNLGGVVESTISMLSNFLNDKLALTIQYNRQHKLHKYTMKNKNKHYFSKLPMVILVNQDTASAAEIFAGVLQDYQMAKIIGMHTYGKSSVQTMISLENHSSLKMTIAKYILPKGRDIARKEDSDGRYISGGIFPDINVPLDFTQHPIVYGEPGKDNQLDESIELLYTMLKNDTNSKKN